VEDVMNFNVVLGVVLAVLVVLYMLKRRNRPTEE
jgi:LPXTG-motif cell wall-anchored protein